MRRGQTIRCSLLQTIPFGVGFRKTARGRNVTAKYLERAMAAIGIKGKFANTQIRSAFITGALETGMKDNEIRAITGHRSETALNSYKQPSLLWKRASKEKMISSLVAGSNSWVPAVKQEPKAITDSIPTSVVPQYTASKKVCFTRKSIRAEGVVTQREKLSITDRNQQLFKMLIDQQNAFMSSHELSPATTVHEEYSQEQTDSPAKGLQIPRFGKRALQYQRSKKAYKKFRSAAELGLSL